MIIKETYNHKHGLNLIDKNLLDEIYIVFSNGEIVFKRNHSGLIKKKISKLFSLHGWAERVVLKQSSRLTVNYLKDNVGICFQIGNVARTYADLLKLSYLYSEKIISAGVLAVPCKEESTLLGQNYSNFERLVTELDLFQGIIPTPILILALANDL